MLVALGGVRREIQIAKEIAINYNKEDEKTPY